MARFVLIVEDEAVLGKNMSTYLRHLGYQTLVAEDVSAARKAYRETQPDIILLDHNLPDGTGLALLEEIRREDRWTKIVMITAHGNVDLAVNAMKRGADDYISKPASLEEIGLIVGRFVQQSRNEGSLNYLQNRQKAESGADRIIGESSLIVELRRRIKFLTNAEKEAALRSAEPGLPVLILGETGTGKELVAKALHYDGPRADKPFVSINCATLPEHLVESELFGHERGAFSGATEKKVGLFQAGDGGTIFLDEIGELPLNQQAKLLKAIEDRVIRPVGSTRDRQIDVRFIAATNVHIEEKSRRSEFRADLYYRLNRVLIETPPLRARKEDVVTIANSILAHSERRFGRTGLYFDDSARAALQLHSWPGNVRELRNVVEQSAMMSPREGISAADLILRVVEDTPVPAAAKLSEETNLPETEKKLIIAALRQMHGNVTLAAQMLGISRDTLRYRMEKHDLQRDYYKVQVG
jgi:two-component system, NtrC family, response regulator AtoC